MDEPHDDMRDVCGKLGPLCKLTPDQFRDWQESIAERGANNALKRIGLGDAQAANDIAEIRRLVGGMRNVRKVAWDRAVGIGVTVFSIYLLTAILPADKIKHILALAG